jgi:alkylation response protein AidB-like acyl-CoA dehydrogenase
VALVLTEEQHMLSEAAAEVLGSKAGCGALRRLRDGDEPRAGYDPDLWHAMIELGWTGVLVAENDGGLGFGHVGMGQIAEHCGRSLAISPLFSTAVVGTTLITHAGNSAQKAETLPAIASGALTTALAVDESPRHAPELIECRARPSGEAFVLSGEKLFVVDGNHADCLIVAARMGDSDDIGLFMLSSQTPGVAITRTPMTDTSNAAMLHFSDVRIGADSLLSGADNTRALSHTLDIANVHLAAELLGIAVESLERAVRYLKERKQFGLPIGSFQALQHRAATLWAEIELLKSLVLHALQAADESDDDIARLCSAAKARACRVAELATNESLQMHGGVGMTDDFDIGLYLKRARVAQALFGDHRYHEDRYARLSGY